MKIMFFHADMLGWSTYTRTIESYVQHRPEIDACYVRQGRSSLDPSVRSVVKAVKPVGSIARSVRRNVLAGTKYYSRLKSFKPDIVHVAGHSLARVPCLFNTKIPIVATSDGSEYQSRQMAGSKESQFSRAWKREYKILHSLTEIHCTSEWCAASMTQDFDIHNERVKVTRYSLKSPDVCVELDRRQNELLNIMFVGNDYQRKGALELVDVHQSHFKDVAKLHLFSNEIPFQEYGENVEVHRNINQKELIDHWYPMMDMFVLPSKYDQTPYAIVEALSFGLPVIVSDVGGLPEMVGRGDAGIVIRRDVRDDLQRGIARLVESLEVRVEFGLKARTQYQKLFDAEKTIPAFIDRLISLAEVPV